MADLGHDKELLDSFWDPDSDYFTGPPLSDGLIRDIQAQFGYKLPEAYLRLLRVRNGGMPRRAYFLIDGLPGWTSGYLRIDNLRGIGGDWGIDTNDMGNNYPDVGLIIGDTPSGGHDAVMLDYSQCGPTGEPRVIHAVQGWDASRTVVLAPSFEEFIRALVSEPPDESE